MIVDRAGVFGRRHVNCELGGSKETYIPVGRLCPRGEDLLYLLVKSYYLHACGPVVGIHDLEYVCSDVALPHSLGRNAQSKVTDSLVLRIGNRLDCIHLL